MKDRKKSKTADAGASESTLSLRASTVAALKGSMTAAEAEGLRARVKQIRKSWR